ncbi:uncharacterized protein METZ01_LOCUS29292 [marine metagenome]|uniref:Uncharacterized protein n=1 Tax=marine metagenome TaxID=408172 RepID=A0A381QBV2_9ZZZZ
MNEAPKKDLKFKNSANISHPKNAAKTASMLMTIAAWLGGEKRCPIICKTKAIHTEPTEQYKSVTNDKWSFKLGRTIKLPPS